MGRGREEWERKRSGEREGGEWEEGGRGGVRKVGEWGEGGNLVLMGRNG